MATTRCIALAILVVTGTLLVLGNLQGTSAQCQHKIPSLITECAKFVQKTGPKVPPSPGCCGVLEGADIPCFCKLITPVIEEQISMDKVVYVARTCGCNVPVGMKCGSYTVPPNHKA